MQDRSCVASPVCRISRHCTHSRGEKSGRGGWRRRAGDVRRAGDAQRAPSAAGTRLNAHQSWKSIFSLVPAADGTVTHSHSAEMTDSC